MPIEIIPHIWLGDYKDAEHVTESVKLVVNCTPNIPFFCREDVNKIRIPVIDLDDNEEQETMRKYWRETNVFESMLNQVLQGHDVLVHCQMGRQRSAATIAAFLMTGGMRKSEAIALIKSKKREAFFPAVNFDKALSKLMWDLANKRDGYAEADDRYAPYTLPNETHNFGIDVSKYQAH